MWIIITESAQFLIHLFITLSMKDLGIQDQIVSRLWFISRNMHDTKKKVTVFCDFFITMLHYIRNIRFFTMFPIRVRVVHIVIISIKLISLFFKFNKIHIYFHFYGYKNWRMKNKTLCFFVRSHFYYIKWKKYIMVHLKGCAKGEAMYPLLYCVWFKNASDICLQKHRR